MKLLLPIFAMLGLLAPLPAAEETPPNKPAVRKKGFGLPERKGMDAHHLDLLKVGWFYNWGSQTKISGHAQFVPMMFSLKTANPKNSGNDFILGYNEPDNTKQSDLSVKEALKNWSDVTSKGKFVISPAMAGNAVTKDWLNDFMKGKPKVDAIAFHWYKGVEASKFIKDLEELHAHFKKPIWVTEFAPQTAASSEETPDKFTHAQVKAFIDATTDFMEKTPWVHRYAWHHSGTGTSALFTEKGELTPTGKAYAAAGK
jgi:hypothetical protein